jgi:hypothetical protein
VPPRCSRKLPQDRDLPPLERVNLASLPATRRVLDGKETAARLECGTDPHTLPPPDATLSAANQDGMQTSM